MKMKFLLLSLFVGCAVKCDENNPYYLIRRPERQPLKVYWNSPTKQCKSKKIPFEDLFSKFGIIQNSQDKFPGDKISILYDPGLFPAILSNADNQFMLRNGGVPQEGDLQLHLEEFRKRVEESIDKDFSGVGVIDFESWRPILRQNFGSLTPYKKFSYDIEREKHPWWLDSMVKAEAKRRFEAAGVLYMNRTLELAKQLRPNAVWGYYAYPYCFNMGQDMQPSCSKVVKTENDEISWLWEQSTALFPSVYSSTSLSTSQLVNLIKGRVTEAARVRNGDQPILPYFWYRYRDGTYLREDDLQAALKAFYDSEATGFIVWGSSNDVKTVDQCRNLLKYIETTFGPAVAKYTKPNNEAKPNLRAGIKNYTAIYTTPKKNFIEVDRNVTKPINDDDDTHHIEIINGGTNFTKPDIPVNITLFDAILKTWLLNIDQRDKTTDHESATSTVRYDSIIENVNVSNTNLSIYTTKETIVKDDVKDIIKTNALSETPMDIDDIVVSTKDSNHQDPKIARREHKKNLSEIPNISEPNDEVTTQIKTTQVLSKRQVSKDKRKGVAFKINHVHVHSANTAPPITMSTTTIEPEIFTETTTISETKKYIRQNIPKYEKLDSTDVSQVSKETDDENALWESRIYDTGNEKTGLMSSQTHTEIIDNFIDLSKEELIEGPKSIEMADKIFNNENTKKELPEIDSQEISSEPTESITNIPTTTLSQLDKDKKKGQSNLVRRHHHHHHHHEITTERDPEITTNKSKIKFKNEGDTTNQNSAEITKITTPTGEYFSVTTEIATDKNSVSITEDTTPDDFESRTNIPEFLFTDKVPLKVELLETGRKTVRSADDAGYSDSMELEKEPAVSFI